MGMSAVQASQKYINIVREHPAKSNRSPDIDRWVRAIHMEPGIPWCATFVSNMFFEGSGVWPDFTSASSQAFRRWATKNHRFFSDPDYLLKCKGAIFGWTNGDKIHGHVGLVRARFTSSKEVIAIGTIEGNTNAGGDRNGDGVYSLRRGAPVDGRHTLWFVDTSGIPGGEWW